MPETRGWGKSIQSETFLTKKESLVLKLEDTEIELSLTDWEKDGLKIGFNVEGLGQGTFNKQPYANEKIAKQEYARIAQNIKEEKYFVEIHPNGELKLRIIN